MNEKLVDIAFPLPLTQTYTYIVPSELQSFAKIGCRVIAPFGARKLTGFIVAYPEKTTIEELKEIQDVLDLNPLISPEILKLAAWISEYYICSLGEALKVFLPAGFTQTSKIFIEITTDSGEYAAKNMEKRSPRQAQILRYLLKSGKMSVQQLKRKLSANQLFTSLNQLEEKKLIKQTINLPGSFLKPKIERYVEAINQEDPTAYELQKKTKLQSACLNYLLAQKNRIPQKELLQKTGATLSTLKALENKALIRITEETILRDYYNSIPLQNPKLVTLNDEQERALANISKAINEGVFKTFLLFGVTGSGKTQVYIEAIAETFKQGKSAIVLVPEISLTPQTVQRFRSYFKDKVAVLHSAMSEGERMDSWQRIKKGEATLVIGPRSAILAPLENIGLVVVDEEHEATYKQSDSTPRYHARDVAVMRAKYHNAVVVLGSATPSTESFFNTRIQKYALLELRRRVNDAALPQVKIIDMRKEKRLSGKREEPVFSRVLAYKINEKIARNEQVILLLNRRGFSSYIKCKDCGYIAQCEHCNITLTYHIRGKRLRCHYCGFTKHAPEVCPDCSGADILFRGMGTQKVEQEIKARFPAARLVRMDLDTTSEKWSHDRILTDFGAGEYDILLGTQMVAKGLDFSKVTLVGVINADVGLLVPDFRANERTFQLLTQVAGRAGRQDLAGEVIIQTYSPDNFCLYCAQEHDFIKFYNNEITVRQKLNYPPQSRIICIRFLGENEAKVMEAAQKYAKIINLKKAPFEILGPSPAPINRIKNKYRVQILMKGIRKDDTAGLNMRQAVIKSKAEFIEQYKSRGIRITIDVDPVSVV